MRILLGLLGAVLILAGLLTVWTPVPTGIPLLLLGLAMLMNVSSRTRDWVMKRSEPWPRLGKLLARLGNAGKQDNNNKKSD